MINLSEWALANKKLINFLVTMITLGGVIAYLGMPKLEDPEIKVKEAMVITVYPGASSHEVELEVTDRLEKSIRTIKDVENVTSTSMNDVSLIRVGLSTLVSNEDVEQNWDLLRRKVHDVQSQLPAGAGPSVVADNFGDVYGIFYALTYDGYRNEEAVKYAELLKRHFQKIDGVSDVIIYGAHRQAVEIELHEDKLASFGVHPAMVLATLKAQNASAYPGYYESGPLRMRLAISDRYKTAEDIGDIILQGYEGDQLRIRDIASVSDGYEKPVRNGLRHDRRKAVGIAVSVRSDADIIKVGKQVESARQRIEQDSFPAGMEISKVFFQPDRVKDALGGFVVSLLESVLLVILVLIFSMGFRSGMILGWGLVVTVVGSVLMLNVFDGTLQRVSLGSFILAMGMLVDNSIVILDGIQVALSKGLDRRTALTDIGKRTAMPLLGATLIAILTFLPIFLSPDTSGIYVRDLFIVLSVSLLLSWVLALVMIPIQADRYLKIKPLEEGRDPYMGKGYEILKKTLTLALSHRKITVSVATVLVAVSAFCYRFIPQGFFPDMDYDQLYIEYRLPDGYNPERVDQDLQEIEKYLLGRDEVTHVTTSMGGTPARYNLVRSIATPSLSYGELIVDYKSSDAAVATLEEVQDDLRMMYPDAQIRVKRYNLMYKEFPIEVQFAGPDPEVLHTLTDQASEIMRKHEGVSMVRSNWFPKIPVLKVDYDQSKARELGLSRQDLSISLLTATDGIPVGSFHEGNTSKSIVVRSVDKDGNPIEGLNNIPTFGMLPSFNGLDIHTLQGVRSTEDLYSALFATSPLSSAISGITLEWEEPIVIRYNGERAMRTQCMPKVGYTAEEIRSAVAEEIESITLPDGYSFKWEGEYNASMESKKYLFRYYPMAVILIIALLIMLFKDYRRPVIILLCLPLLGIGIVFGMLLSGKAFGFVAIVAALGLMGMLIKNAIVLVDEIESMRRSGVDAREALIQSSMNRFRPIMLASLTTILGMIPLLSDSLFGAMAVVIMSGLLVGTLASLVFLPVLYAMFFKIK